MIPGSALPLLLATTGGGINPRSYFDVKLYTGNGSTQTISGLEFSPDLVWIKCRSEASTNPAIWDTVRGPGTSNSDTNRLSTNNANAEETVDPYGYVSAFNSDGITVEKGSTATVSNTNRSGQTYVAWTWDAGSSTVTNTDGSISSQVRANPSAGFSVVTYTGNNTTTPSPMPTVGHGLNIAPSLVISKSRNNAGVESGNWFVWHTGAGTGNWLRLNTTDAAASISSSGGGAMVAPTSTVFSTPYISGSNINGNNYVAYCFAPVAGYSAFGSYTGNGSAGGPIISGLGFTPYFVMIKASSTTGDWWMYDGARSTTNPRINKLKANSSDVEDTAGEDVDFQSDGFQIKTANIGLNQNAATYIYAAFA